MARGKSYDRAKQLSEAWHGRESRGSKNITNVIKFSKNIVDLGELELLGILTEPLPDEDLDLERIEVEKDPTDPKGTIYYEDLGIEPINFPEGVILSSTPVGNQLLVVCKSDICIDLKQAHWLHDREKKKDKVDLGEVFSIGYFTDKHHLEGPETQKDGTSYIHVFGVKTGIRPRLIYDRINCSIELVGGAYTIEDIGICG